jgi:hypothetical protein
MLSLANLHFRGAERLGSPFVKRSTFHRETIERSSIQRLRLPPNIPQSDLAMDGFARPSEPSSGPRP